MAETFDGNTIRKVQNMLKRGETGTLRDGQCAGLAIRVHKSTATWSMITRDGKWTIGPLDFWSAADIPMLRSAVTQARQIQKEGRDPKDFFAALKSERDVELATHRAAVSYGIGSTWENVRDAYIHWIYDHREKETARGYKSALGATKGSVLEQDFTPLAGKPIASITTKDLVRVRSNIVKRGDGEKLRQADLTVSALKSCFKWYVNQPDSEIEVSPATTLSKVLERKKERGVEVSSTERVFTQDEIGLLILGLESITNHAARLSVMIQLLTGQRRRTPLEAKKSLFEEHPDYGMTWRLSDKVDAWRVLPLPPAARSAVETAMSLTREDNVFLFPQQRPRKQGGPMDGHMNERTVSTVLETLRDKDGILSTLPFSPSTHHLRRTFVTIMTPKMSSFTLDDRRLTADDVQIITHENEGRKTTASLVYDKNAYLDVKYKILEFWEQWCLEGYHNIKNKMR